MDKFYKFVRILTLAPLLAGFAIVCIALCCPDTFLSVWQFVYTFFFLCVLPLLAYPLQKYIPHFEDAESATTSAQRNQFFDDDQLRSQIDSMFTSVIWRE